MDEFGFAFDERYRGLLAVAGVRPATSWIRLHEEHLEVRFGLWRLRTPLSNVEGVTPSGPFQALKAIGPRVSLADRGLTFGSTARAGVCVRFRQPVGWLRHPALTLTPEDPERLAARLSQPSPGTPGT
ncbi:hypothetical protein JOF53_002093 [Crossiella equi]|uniref:Uncharacterized protein n=1 Tax=Crossiella equi TaxID=130796 RepID=A0ABS5A9G7_9PSEU|nr:hypothetical protein [Crossiella equi]MBP2473221.1 hypothetical protein [Crossiella equi]